MRTKYCGLSKETINDLRSAPMTEPTPRDKVRTHTKALGEASYMLEHLADSLARQTALLREFLNAENCPYCPNQGWYADRDRASGDPVQVQCEFCHTNQKSVFNIKARIERELEKK